MLSNEPAQTIAIREIRHRDKVSLEIYVSYKPGTIGQVKRILYQLLSLSMHGWNISYTISHYQTLPALLSFDKTEYPPFLQEQTN